MLSGVPLLVAYIRNRIPLSLGHEGPVCHLSLRLEGAAMSSYMFNMHRASPIVSCSGFYSPRFRPVRLPSSSPPSTFGGSFFFFFFPLFVFFAFQRERVPREFVRSFLRSLSFSVTEVSALEE